MMEKRKKLHIAAVMLFFIFLAVFCTFKYNQLVRSSICASLLFFFIRPSIYLWGGYCIGYHIRLPKQSSIWKKFHQFFILLGVFGLLMILLSLVITWKFDIGFINFLAYYVPIYALFGGLMAVGINGLM